MSDEHGGYDVIYGEKGHFGLLRDAAEYALRLYRDGKVNIQVVPCGSPGEQPFPVLSPTKWPVSGRDVSPEK